MVNHHQTKMWDNTLILIYALCFQFYANPSFGMASISEVSAVKFWVNSARFVP